VSWEGLAAIFERLRLRLWFIPALFALAAFLSALVMVTIDRRLAEDGLTFIRFGGTADGARSVLSTIAQSMLTFTGLVFTITMLVLQLAANSLSPRVMRTFLRDRQNQVVLGLFVATFVFTLLVLREVRAPVGDAGFVPGLAVWTAFALLLASVAAFVYYIDHMAHAIRASTVIDNIANETREAVEARYAPERDASGGAMPRLDDPDPAIVASERGATLIAVDDGSVVDLAAEHDLVVELIPSVGDFIVGGGPLFRVYRMGQAGGRALPDDLPERLRGTLSFGNERTLHQDHAFGLRQLVDVAARALSPGTNDPTTAVQAIDRIHDLLRIIATRPDPDPVHRDDDGRPRLIRAERSWADLVELGFDELRLYGAAHLHVAARLRLALADLLSVACDDRRPALLDQRERLEAAVTRAYEDRRDRRAIETGAEPRT
jgi:uncharacterized membrane protein